MKGKTAGDSGTKSRELEQGYREGRSSKRGKSRIQIKRNEWGGKTKVVNGRIKKKERQ